MRTPVALVAVLAAVAVAAPPAHAADGDLDGGFGTGGLANFGCGGDDEASDATVQSGNRVVISGSMDTQVCVMRLTDGGVADPAFGDGGTDTTFGGDGTTVFRYLPGSTADTGLSVVPLSDGKLLVAGATVPGGGDTGDLALARLNENGTLDTSFGGDGTVNYDFDGAAPMADDRAVKVMVESDGRYLVAGNQGNNPAVARVFPSGGLDDPFGRSFAFPGNQVVHAAVLDGTSAVLVGESNGLGGGTGTNNFAMRVSAGGPEDATFGDGGDAAIEVNVGGEDRARAVVPYAGGFVLGGQAGTDLALLRLTSNGQVDTGFDGDGKVITDLAGDEEAAGLTTSVDGKLLLGFSLGTDLGVAKYLPNGVLDQSFSGDGRQTVNAGGNEVAQRVVVQQDGKMVLVGKTNAPGPVDNYISARLLDSLPVASIGDVAGPEGSELAFPVTLNKPAGLGVNFGFRTTDGSAVAPGDFDGGESEIQVAPNETAGVARRNALADNLLEPDETFGVELFTLGTPPVTFGRQAATGNITNVLMPGRCANSIFGSPAGETINGTSLGDTIDGAGGNDRLNGVNGDDCLRGGLGRDDLQGGNGADDLRGDDGNDTLNGAKGKDVLRGGRGNDRLNGSKDSDVLSGEVGNDKLTGTDGKDRMSGGDGNDDLSGGGDNDTLDGGRGADKINAGTGKNKIQGGAGNDNIATQNGKRDKVDCGAGRDRVRADRIDSLKSCEVRVTRR